MTSSSIKYSVILTLCACCAFNVALYVHINPFVADFLLSIGIDEHDVGTYTGLAESLCFGSQFLSNPFWTYIAGRYPKRTLMFWSVTSASTAGCLFGLSTQVWHVILLRIALGCCHCLFLMPPLILGENVPKEHLPRAFAWIGTSNTLGGAIGHFIGGYLALPAGRIPILGDIPLLHQKPYLLPGLTLSLFSIVIMIAVMANIPIEQNRTDTEVDAIFAETSDRGSSNEVEPAVQRSKVHWTDVMKNRKFCHLLAANTVMKLSGTGYDAWMSAGGHLSPLIGGLGLSVDTLGNLLSASDILALLTLFIIFPKLIQAVSNRTMTMIIALAVVYRAVYYPFANLLAMRNPNHDALFWVISVIGVISKSIQSTWAALGQVFMISLFPDSDLRTYSVGVHRQFGLFGMTSGIYMYGHLFTISSRGEIGSVTRQLLSIVAGAVASAALGLALTQQQVTAPSKPSAAETRDEEADESTALLAGRERRAEE